MKSGETKRAVGHCGAFGRVVRGSVITLEVLLMVTVKAYEDDPFGGTKAGEMAQAEGAGAPLHVSTTLPLNPLTDDTCKLYAAAWPAVTTAAVEQFPPAGQLEPLATSNEKSVPTPVSGIL